MLFSKDNLQHYLPLALGAHRQQVVAGAAEGWVRSKRFGFVTFVNAEAAQRAIAAPPEIDGQSVIVNYNNDHKR